MIEQLKELHDEISANKLRPSKDIRLGHSIDKWLRDFKRPEVSPRTYEWYANISKMIPDDIKASVLADRPLCGINPKGDHIIHPVGFFKDGMIK